MNRKNFLAALAAIPFLPNPLAAIGQTARRSSQVGRQVAHRFAAYNHLGLRFLDNREVACFSLTHPTAAGESISRFVSTYSWSSKRKGVSTLDPTQLSRQFRYQLISLLRDIEKEHGMRGIPPNPVGVFRWTWEPV